MAKMACISGAVVGKIGGNVYSVNSGQQIVRAYQPNVANPKTDPQVSNRTKFKLASQLAASFSPVIAISKDGMVSGRNQFVSHAMQFITEQDGEANVQLSKLQLTKSSIILPSITLTVNSGGILVAELTSSPASLGVTKVVYARFDATGLHQLLLRTAPVVSDPGEGHLFSSGLGIATSVPSFVYAYGIIEEDNDTLTKYQDYQIDNATFIASLISTRSAATSGLKTTSTSYAYHNPQQNSTAAPSHGGSSDSNADKGKK